MSTEARTVEQVAKALYHASITKLPYTKWGELTERSAAPYRRMAVAAIEAMQLTHAVVPRDVIKGTVKSFRDVEGLQLYDAATHRWIDLLDDVTSRRVGIVGYPTQPEEPK